MEDNEQADNPRKKFRKEYKTWCNIKWRCHCPTARDYHKYGARGITVFEGWRESFEVFLKDVGASPGKDYSLERLDNELGYAPENVKWAKIKEQNRNRRNTRFIECYGKQVYFADFCKLFGLEYSSARRKLARGRSAEELIKGKSNGETERRKSRTKITVTKEQELCEPSQEQNLCGSCTSGIDRSVSQCENGEQKAET